MQSFFVFANFYQRFIAGYLEIALPLTAFTKTVEKFFMFFWKPKRPKQKAFETLKHFVTTAPILANFNPNFETWVESDASNYAIAAVLSEKHQDRTLQPVTFMSKKIFLVECNYEIYDKKLLAIICAFAEWRLKLAGTLIEDLIYVITDHKNLEYFMTSKDLNRRQA